MVAGKGYHSNGVLRDLKALEMRSYISAPGCGRRNWCGKRLQQQAVYGNRRRMRGKRGKRLSRMRGERAERSFARLYETGRMRRTHLRGHENILKRLLASRRSVQLVAAAEEGAGSGHAARALRSEKGFWLALGGRQEAVFGAANALVLAGAAPGERVIPARLATRRLRSRSRCLKTATSTTGC